MPETPATGGVRNSFAGDADAVVQAGSVHGGVHVHLSRPSVLPTPQQLPADVGYFTGRGVEQSKLDALLEGGRSGRPAAVVISAIAGAAGVGKTSLALHWAHRVRDQFPHGELYVNLRGYDPDQPITPEQALDGFLRALDVPGAQIPRTLDVMVGVYRSLLTDRRMLVVLDNAATAEQVRPLLPGSPTCMVVVTSRNRLSGLVARDGAHRITLDVLAADEATSLLRNVIGTGRTDREPDATAVLARQCAYLPLALRIAAERVIARPHVTVTEFVQTLVDEHRRLDLLAADDDEIAAVRAVFSWSYYALSPGAARVFRLLGLHPGPDISIDAAAALTCSTTIDLRRWLGTLTSVHMLTEAGRDRYQFHDLLRDYASERAAIEETDDDRAEAVRRVLEWYLHTTHAALRVAYPQHPEIPVTPINDDCRPLAFDNRDQAHQWFDAERTNLMVATRHASQVGEHTVAWQLPNALDYFLDWRYYRADQIFMHQLGLAAAQKGLYCRNCGCWFMIE